MADPRRPFAPPGQGPEFDADQSFLDRMGLVKPRNGQAGVTRVGGVGGTGALPPQQPRVQPVTTGLPGGRPAGPGPLGGPTGGFIKPGGATPAPVGGRPEAPPTGGFTPPSDVRPSVPPGGVFTPPSDVRTVPPPAQGVQPPAGGQVSPSQPGAQAAPAAAPQQIDSQGRAFTAPRVAVPRQPSRGELAQYDPNTVIDTPYGQLVTNPETGQRELNFTPQGKIAYAKETQRLRSRLGPNPARGMRGAPEMEIEPGKPVFDAFNGRWVK